MAGFLNRKGIPFTRGVTVPLYVPANAEIVIEGYVSAQAGFPGYDPRETNEDLGEGAVFEGPFGDHTGYYSMPDRYPILEVTAVTHARDAIYPTTIVGLPTQEDYFLGKATERIFLPLLKTIIHDIEDYDLPMCGAFHNCAAIRIEKSYPLQARRVMHAVWGAGQMAWTKCVMVVDERVDVHDIEQVLRRSPRTATPTGPRDRQRPARHPRPRRPAPGRRDEDRLRRDQQAPRRGDRRATHRVRARRCPRHSGTSTSPPCARSRASARPTCPTRRGAAGSS